MRQIIERSGFIFLVVCNIIALDGCKKLVQIPAPVNSITTGQTFSNDLQATEAMVSVYNGMINTGGGLNAFCGGATIYSGASADELVFFDNSILPAFQFQTNSLLSNNPYVASNFWVAAYSTIYGCNSVLSGVSLSTSIHDSVRNELTGEAEFVRAFAYFYLTNWFGNVPLVMTIDYNKTSLLTNASIDTIYSAIIADLKDAASRLPSDYSVGHGQRIIPNRWAALALLARVYLYRGDWADAETNSSAVINNTGLFGLVSDLNAVFLANSGEAIWQLQESNQDYPFNATPEGNYILPPPGNQPNVYITPSLLSAFEDSDQRQLFWLDSTNYNGITYYFPYKYRIGPANNSPNGTDSAYYMVLRLGEQFLIRAEAEANGAGGGIGSAVADLDMIRGRAGLGPYAGQMVKDPVLAAIYHERQVELFAEWGHRWLDLRRWGNALRVLSADKGTTLQATDLLYPIPIAELQTDPNLIQNPGYQ